MMVENGIDLDKVKLLERVTARTPRTWRLNAVLVAGFVGPLGLLAIAEPAAESLGLDPGAPSETSHGKTGFAKPVVAEPVFVEPDTAKPDVAEPGFSVVDVTLAGISHAPAPKVDAPELAVPEVSAPEMDGSQVAPEIDAPGTVAPGDAVEVSVSETGVPETVSPELDCMVAIHCDDDSDPVAPAPVVPDNAIPKARETLRKAFFGGDAKKF